MATMTDYPLELLHDALEDQFRYYTDRLVELTIYSQQPDCGGYDRDTLNVLVAAARQGVADTAQALRSMSDGTYGVCQDCSTTIPAERLRALPHVRSCVSCQRLQLP